MSRHVTPMLCLLTALALNVNTAWSKAPDAISPSDTAAIEQITGMKGKLAEEENVFKVAKPRNDVGVNVDRMPLPPFMGLSSWAAFTPAHGQLMMMGDTVVFEDEVNPAMSAALDAGLEVTALHNHFFFDEPRVYFMHIGGAGSATALASGVRKVQDAIAAVRIAHPVPAREFTGLTPDANHINGAPLEAILGQKGETSNGLFKVTIGRPASMHGVPVGKEMGINTWAGFAGTDEMAIVDGDFAVLPNELQAVLKSLRHSGVNIVAIHQHMSHEEPRYLFLHYWGKGRATDLAASVRKALDEQAALR